MFGIYTSGVASADPAPLSVSVVIPVYLGEATLPALIAELAELIDPLLTPNGRRFRIGEVLLVWDRGTAASHDVIRELADRYPWVKPIWLSRNFGQHAATLAGMTSSGGDWIVTMDEDGQMDPLYVGAMLDRAYASGSQLVYAAPDSLPHSSMRNTGSRLAKWLFTRFLADQQFAKFNSYRLVLGEVGRSVAAYTGTGVYLDVALSWVVSDSTTCPVRGRQEGRPAGGYNYRRLASHFGRLVVSSGTRPLVFVSWLGIAFVVIGALTSIYVLFERVTGGLPVTGWASLLVAVLVIGGAILLSLGIIAQYVGASTNMSLGKPLYVIVRDPALTFDPHVESSTDPTE